MSILILWRGCQDVGEFGGEVDRCAAVTAGPHTFAQKARAAKAQGFSVRRSDWPTFHHKKSSPHLSTPLAFPTP